MRTVVALAFAFAVSGCAEGSYVAAISTPHEANPVANAIVDFTTAHLSGGSVALEPAQAANYVTPALVHGLKAAGFSVVKPGTEGAHRLRYVVTPLDNGDLVRITLDDDAVGARFFARSRWGLRAAGPFTVRLADAGGTP